MSKEKRRGRPPQPRVHMVGFVKTKGGYQLIEADIPEGTLDAHVRKRHEPEFLKFVGPRAAEVLIDEAERRQR